MKVVITGGLGFIGMAVASRLLTSGHGVLLLDSLTPQVHGDVPSLSPPPGAEVMRLDVRELPQRFDVLEGADAVCHFAAETGTGQSMHKIVHYVDVNDGGTAAVLEAIANCSRRPKRLILSSSRSVYGEGAYLDTSAGGRIVHPPTRSAFQLAAGRWDHCDATGEPLVSVPTPESMQPSPGSVYAATKVAQEMLVAATAGSLGLTATILRFQNVYGEGQSLRNPYTGIISIFFNRARQGLPIPVYEDGRESRDFVHVSDVVRAVEQALEAELPPNAILNVGSGVATSVQSLAQQLLQAAALQVPVEVTRQYRVGDIRHCHADLEAIRSLLGWTPTTSLEHGLQRFCAWARNQPVQIDRLDAATAELRRHGLTSASGPAP